MLNRSSIAHKFLQPILNEADVDKLKTNNHPLLLLLIFFILMGLGNIDVFSQTDQRNDIFPGADEDTPSLSQYFSWINNTNEGSTEKQTLLNLDFFKWLHDEYGMVLDIYVISAGAIDKARWYGSMDSDEFKHQFPNDFDFIFEKAKAMKTRLGTWGGPDGFGETAEEEQARIDMMVKLCRDYDFILLKFDAVVGQLRSEKQDAFIRMMTECRKYSPDLLLLNHRLNLNDEAKKHATTYLLGGRETYIDVHMSNNQTAQHHRAAAISRKLVPDLQRLTEDHGVCLSSCLDYWEDDLVLQAFNRCLILAPQIYGNPWFLRDDEFPMLARIFNLFRKYRAILINGLVLPENQYGPYALSRGDETKRFITLRNLIWTPVNYTISLDYSIGLQKKEKVQVRQYHPTERFLGTFAYGSKIEVEVSPFRSCLLEASTQVANELYIEGCDYRVIREVEGKPTIVKLLAMPGEKCEIKLSETKKNYTAATIEGKHVSNLLKGKSVQIQFAGTAYKDNYHRKIGTLQVCNIPDDAMSYYEATCFAADNNALEVRSLQRSGPTLVPQVERAREAFFSQKLFSTREIWDRYAFDDDKSTAFSVCNRWRDVRIKGGSLRINFDDKINLDKLLIETFDEFSLQPWKSEEGKIAYISSDLINWQSVRFFANKKMEIDLSGSDSIRYLRIDGSPLRICDIKGFKNKEPLNRSGWRASNLFAPYQRNESKKAWSLPFMLDEIPENSYLAIALNGKHGIEGATAAICVEGTYIGAPDRSPSFPSNTWEYPVARAEKNYTFYIPLNQEIIGKQIEVVVLALDKDNLDFTPEVWITAYPVPFKEKILILTSEGDKER
jgi:hypothetical protein